MKNPSPGAGKMSQLGKCLQFKLEDLSLPLLQHVCTHTKARHNSASLESQHWRSKTGAGGGGRSLGIAGLLMYELQVERDPISQNKVEHEQLRKVLNVN